MSEVMKFDMEDKKGLILATKNKYCTHDIKIEPKLKLDSLEITEGGEYEATLSDDAYAFGGVMVNIPLEKATLTDNGEYTPENGKYYDSVTVNVKLDALFPIKKTVTVSPNPTYPNHNDTFDANILTVYERGVPFSELGISVDTFSLYNGDIVSMVNALGEKLTEWGINVLERNFEQRIKLRCTNNPTAYYPEYSFAINNHKGARDAGYYSPNSNSVWVYQYAYLTTGSWLVIGRTHRSDNVSEMAIAFTKPGTYYVFVHGEPRAMYTVVEEESES